MNREDEVEAIGLHDMDGTLAAYDESLNEEYRKLCSPEEVLSEISSFDDYLPHVAARIFLIRSHPGFWANLKPRKLGFDVFNEMQEMGFTNYIVSRGPRKIPIAWKEKKEWCEKHVPETPVFLAHEKSLVYGRVLHDDWPDYFLPWLKVKPRRLVICPAHKWNVHIVHPNVIRYDGNNMDEVMVRLKIARRR